MTMASFHWPPDPDQVLRQRFEVVAAIEAAIRDRRLPPPAAAVLVNGSPPTLHLQFRFNETKQLDAWAELVGAKVGFTDWTYGDVDHEGNHVGAPCHEYGTAAPDSAYGDWHGHTVLLTCTILGPHTISRQADAQ
ncbi:hypothetical protein ACIBTV_27075 [Micromonospora sp. NPDC049366]|uniref:hypothetical protein n=1 Tax=Micromonospora sp. NPDC049366 TaxID=3364271 RepID=UPI0037A82BAE